MRALITGITGQDGSYLADILVEKKYEIFGLIRRTSNENKSRIAHLLDRIDLIPGDITDFESVRNAVKISKPDEIYNLAGQSFVPFSWTNPNYTFDVNTKGLLNVILSIDKKTRVFQASTSEMYGNFYPLFKPMSPYGISKLAAHEIAGIYRNIGYFISCGIMFNHESPRRGNEFVTKKICNFARNRVGKLKLGNVNVFRDWGYSKDYMEAAHLLLQQTEPGDFEIATGQTHSITEFLELALGQDWSSFVEIDETLMRQNEVKYLKGNPNDMLSLGWKPKVNFKALVEMMK